MTVKICGYADRVSAAPGQTLKFMVNCELPSYRAEIVRLICGDSNPNGPGVKEVVVDAPVNQTYPGRRQAIESGSYVSIESHPLLESAESLSLQAMIWPTTPDKGVQVIMAKWRDADQSGIALVIGARRRARRDARRWPRRRRGRVDGQAAPRPRVVLRRRHLRRRHARPLDLSGAGDPLPARR